MQSTQQVESTNELIKAEIGAKATLLNLGKAIQMKLEHAIKKYLTLESASVQNIQISQSILYYASLFENLHDLTSLPNAHEYVDGYLEDDIFKISHNAKFDIKFISKCWYTDPIQVSNYSVISGISAVEFDSNKEINQVISIHGPDTYRVSIHNNIMLKQEYAHGFGVAKSKLKFALESRFIENHTGVDTNTRMSVKVTQIENPKKLKHKGHLKLPKPIQQSDYNLNKNYK
ncbi:hypothetical protein C2G38_2179177 [Gigaspora rosea]|uniref:Uncharacterized protein n=1 Tax=Gigaspora rosea TaxID=44941 RepID=A0A397VKR9_9GLOM|nr:hypothetical protein C2G38_2179177 [Gigaspora rosea]